MAKKTAVKKSASEATPVVKKTAAKKKSVGTPTPKKTAVKKSEKTTTTAETPANTEILAIRALVDVGFGNHLYIRGEGGGLSWDAGQPMACLGAREWQWTTSNAVRPILFKVLVNDQIWSVGNDYIASPGEITVVEPGF